MATAVAPEVDDQSLTVPQAAARLAVAQKTIRRWLRDGKMAGTKLPGSSDRAMQRWRIPRAEVARLQGTSGAP